MSSSRFSAPPRLKKLTAWFGALADGGEIVDALQQRPWGDYDGMVRDRYGVRWLIGYQG
ncbi:hypothetical protein [Microbacterium sp.]|uniref:hypothetical protein n=1 Tax=unclassified Microbacterium TaxID=2609290 RepID=UPI00345866AB